MYNNFLNGKYLSKQLSTTSGVTIEMHCVTTRNLPGITLNAQGAHYHHTILKKRRACLSSIKKGARKQKFNTRFFVVI